MCGFSEPYIDRRSHTTLALIDSIDSSTGSLRSSSHSSRSAMVRWPSSDRVWKTGTNKGWPASYIPSRMHLETDSYSSSTVARILPFSQVITDDPQQQQTSNINVLWQEFRRKACCPLVLRHTHHSFLNKYKRKFCFIFRMPVTATVDVIVRQIITMCSLGINL